jgi:hypothetical protein
MTITTTAPVRSATRLQGWPSLLILFALGCFALCSAPKAFGVVPQPDGGYPGGNTAEGQGALYSVTTGTFNTAVGIFSLRSNSEGQFNTGVGAGALLANTGEQNTATGAGALLSNAAGFGNTANGAFALFSNTNGPSNTATGLYALFANTTGANNVAVGNSSLEDNTTGTFNTALGFTALANNTTANSNTATGASALGGNTVGSDNTANGTFALVNNIEGNSNTAVGRDALLANTSANENTAVGRSALASNTTSGGNTAVGFSALANTTGGVNTAIGDLALYNNTIGASNVALGVGAGYNLTTGIRNVYIGVGVQGVVDESYHTYISNINTTSVSGGDSDFVTVDLTTGLLGHASSSRRYKENIKPMGDSSQALFALNPVTFRYKKEIDKSQSLEYGLIAEDVAQVDPNLAIRNGKGQIESVRYNAVNAMLLNEFLKEHRKVEKLEAAVAQQQDDFQSKFAEQERQIQALASGLQKVSARTEISNSAPQVVTNNQ